MLGSVLCCPGCFSLYRCQAVRDVLPIYATGVDHAFDFLTKDMGEFTLENGLKRKNDQITTDQYRSSDRYSDFIDVEELGITLTSTVATKTEAQLA